MKTKPKIEIAKKIVAPPISVGGLKTHVKITNGDKIILDEPGNSFVGGFIDLLFNCMAWAEPPSMPNLASLAVQSFTKSQNTNGKARLRVGTSNLPYVNEVYIASGWNAGSRIAVVDASSGYLNTDIDTDAGVDEGTLFLVSKGLRHAAQRSGNSIAYLRVGSNSNETTIDSYDLDKNASLSVTDTAVSVVAVDSGTDTAELSFSCLFSNATDEAVKINEVGLYLLAPGSGIGESSYFLVARDKFSSEITIDLGTSLNLKYTLLTGITGQEPLDNGGLTEGFFRLLKNVIATQSSDYIMYNGDSVRTPSSNSSYMATIMSARGLDSMQLRGFNSKFEHWRIGIVCGEGTEQTTDITNYNMNTPIEDDKFRYFANVVETIETGVGSRAIVLKRIIKNISGNSITIGEIGLMLGGNVLFNTSAIPINPGLVAKTVLAAANRVTVPAGYYCELTYKIVVEV